jgi:type I restriction enzyme S subunit
MNQRSAFFLSGEATDPGYLHVRDGKQWAEAKTFTEYLWTTYRPFADPNFLSDARNHFLQRFWEMYLACALIHRGFEVKRVGHEGPEFYFLCEGRRIWVEAIAPDPGTGADRVPESQCGQRYTVPADKILLRYTNALNVKHRRYEAALAKGIIQPGEQIVLAINSRGIPHAPYGAEMPYVVKAFLPFGALTYVVDAKTKKLTDSFHQHRSQLLKANTAPVATTSFLNPRFAHFAAVIHSSVDCANHPHILGEEFLVLHNPMASPSLPKDLFSWCHQLEFYDETLREVTGHTEG